MHSQSTVQKLMGLNSSRSSVSAFHLAPSRGNQCYQHLVQSCRDPLCIDKEIHKFISFIAFTIKKQDYFHFEGKVIEHYFMMLKDDKREKGHQTVRVSHTLLIINERN